MTKQGRFLITTADESTWKFDRPVIFLGEWCRVYDRRHIWQNMDAIVAAPYGLGLSKKDADHLEARALEDMIHPKLGNILNKHHGVYYNERHWKIILGHWLRRYVDLMLNRVNTLEQCLQTYKISGTTVYANDKYALATQNSFDTLYATNDDRWNNALTARILALKAGATLPIEVIGGCTSQGFRFNFLEIRPSLKNSILKWGRHQVGKLANCLLRDSDTFIISSYLPKKAEIKIHLALGQCPQLLNSPKLEMSKKPDLELRKSLASQLFTNLSNNLASIATNILFELLPVCYLEGFSDLNKTVLKLPWPKKPKAIFTANAFDNNEVFKLWAAQKIQSGSKYIIAQHGNNYGTYRVAPSIEEITAEKFLTWGWKDGLPQHTPAFVFKTVGRKTEQYKPLGGLLLIELPLPNRNATFDSHYEYGNYFREQEKFIGALANYPKELLTIRLHSEYRRLKWFEESRWQEFDSSLKFDNGGSVLGDLISQSRLVVHSYDSTGILETLSQNIPTLAFWQNGFEHLRDSAKPYYQLLLDAGIIHLTPESVGQKVNEVWDDVVAWWKQDSVQAARKKFCDKYAKVSQKPIRDLREILRCN